ncbi:MAG: metalloregulator ArsR/SmtB family transcription factor [Lentisphaeria bacterium]|nr:metalloregulator ArsR/SmtB family transcription factor [Lentisphaeria bacterium]
MKSLSMEKVQDRAQLLKSLGHPVRLALLAELARGPKCVTDIRDLLAVAQPSVSQHLSVLRQMELVDCHEDGNVRCYYILRPALVRDLLHFVISEYPKEPQSPVAVRKAGTKRARKESR